MIIVLFSNFSVCLRLFKIKSWREITMSALLPTNAHGPCPQGVYSLVVEADTNNYNYLCDVLQRSATAR